MLHFLAKTAQNIASILRNSDNKVSKDVLEEILIESDIDYDIIETLLDSLPTYPSRQQLEAKFMHFFKTSDSNPLNSNILPCVELIIGVNGAGKTTTIAKLAKLYQSQGKSVLLGAGDTFRAAATQQLKLWGEKLNIPVISSQQGSDPSALAYDTIQSGIAKKVDHIIIDTAGRLHNQTNLQKELEKINRTCAKALNNRFFSKILILDGTQGSSALHQAKIFSQNIGVNGVIITKLDGTSKGGVIFSIIHELQIPVLYIGIGEKEDDLVAFDKTIYVQDLLDCIFIANKE